MDRQFNFLKDLNIYILKYFVSQKVRLINKDAAKNAIQVKKKKNNQSSYLTWKEDRGGSVTSASSTYFSIADFQV